MTELNVDPTATIRTRQATYRVSKATFHLLYIDGADSTSAPQRMTDSTTKFRSVHSRFQFLDLLK